MHPTEPNPPFRASSLCTTYTKPHPPADLMAGRPETHKNAASLKAAANLSWAARLQQEADGATVDGIQRRHTHRVNQGRRNKTEVTTLTDTRLKVMTMRRPGE